MNIHADRPAVSGRSFLYLLVHDLKFFYNMCMKLLFASDIHGSLPATERLLAAFKSEQADLLLLLGDLLYHGPRNDLPGGYNPKQVIPLLNSLSKNIIAVRGNCDAEVDQMVLEFPIMSDYTILNRSQLTILATHGHLPLPPLTCQVIISGHTHIPLLEKQNGVWHMNPGSVSLPKGAWEPSYGIMEGSTATIKTYENTILFSEELK